MQASLKPFYLILGSIVFILLLLALVRQLGFEKQFTNWTTRNQPLMKMIVFTLFIVFAAAAVPVFLHLFLALQHKAGHGNLEMIRLLSRHSAKLVYAAWIFIAPGLLVALPMMIWQGFFKNQPGIS